MDFEFRVRCKFFFLIGFEILGAMDIGRLYLWGKLLMLVTVLETRVETENQELHYFIWKYCHSKRERGGFLAL